MNPTFTASHGIASSKSVTGWLQDSHPAITLSTPIMGQFGDQPSFAIPR